MEKLLTANEVAELLSVHENWVYAAAAAGRMPSIKVGRARRFSRGQLEAWVAQLGRAA